MKVGETIENYLETIFILLKDNKTIRSIDVVNEMGYSKPTISLMMKQLREGGYIVMGDSGLITLTEKGDNIARKIYERHVLLTEIFIELGVTEKTAREDACKIEHCLSKETFQCIKDFYLGEMGCKED